MAGIIIDFFNHVFEMAFPWPYWIFLLAFLNGFMPLVFWRSSKARWVFSVFILQSILMLLLFYHYGYSRVLGIAHSGWIFLIPYLYFAKNSIPKRNVEYSWVWTLIIVNSLALILDFVDFSLFMSH
ncbi:MAG: hypothetical protein CL678_03090 [Bdellovibrionaceae bacterium]|nr:hypothetical protein [Pseudobdellovibrionaceae bacterium]|tara:strand:- start:517 stop:894 length:378 start_codon:yes stop_codon:yes gene_type:complete